MKTHCNEANMLIVRHFILEYPEKFDMASLGDGNVAINCKTACCIAGWASRMSEDKERDVEGSAENWLGLSHDTARRLFYAYTDNDSVTINLNFVTPEQAAEAINNVITYGSPHWQEIIRDEAP